MRPTTIALTLLITLLVHPVAASPAIDIGTDALRMGKDIYPEIDVAHYSARIDRLAAQVRRCVGDVRNPDFRIRCLNTVLFRVEKFQAHRDPAAQRRQENYYLNRVLETKTGNCFSLPLLYVAVAQRLGWPVSLVHVPDHSFVRYVDATLGRQNIEVTSGGRYVPDERYRVDFRVSEAGQQAGTYMRTLLPQELRGDLLAVNAVAFSRRGDWVRAQACLQEAVRQNPRFADAWKNLSLVYQRLSKRSEATQAARYLRQAQACEKTLERLGFVPPSDVPAFNRNGKPTR